MRHNCSHINKEEWNLLSAFINGDRIAAREFFEKYGGIIKYAVGKVDTEGMVIDKEDLFQEAIIHILRDDKKIIRDFEGKSKFSTYLYIICWRYAKKMAKKNNNMCGKETSLPEEIPAPLMEETEVWDADQKKALLEGVEQLNEDKQLFIRLMFYDSRSTSEIMAVFDYTSPNSVYSKRNKIITELKKITKKIMKTKDYFDD